MEPRPHTQTMIAWNPDHIPRPWLHGTQTTYPDHDCMEPWHPPLEDSWFLPSPYIFCPLLEIMVNPQYKQNDINLCFKWSICINIIYLFIPYWTIIWLYISLLHLFTDTTGMVEGLSPHSRRICHDPCQYYVNDCSLNMSNYTECGNDNPAEWWHLQILSESLESV